MRVEPLKSIKLDLRYKTDSFHHSVKFDSNLGRTTPDRTLIAAAQEIARIAEIAGCGRDLENAVRQARQAVKDFRKGRGDT